MNKITILGAGSWGTAITRLLAPQTNELSLWAREEHIVAGITANHKNPVYIKDFVLSDNVSATTSLEEALRDTDAIVYASPSAYVRNVCKASAPFVPKDAHVLVLSKGIEIASHKLMHEIVADELHRHSRISALSGPNHAEEIALGVTSAAVIASEELESAVVFQELLTCPNFRGYVSEDIVGVETCGAVKNIIAIASGVASALGAGDNTLAVLMTRGVAEMSRIAHALGGQAITCMGLAGMGDLIVTCTSSHSRNRSFGEALVRGESLEGYEARTHMVVEGAQAAKSVCELARDKGIEVPISSAVYALLYEGASIEDAKDMLVSRIPQDEFYGLEV